MAIKHFTVATLLLLCLMALAVGVSAQTREKVSKFVIPDVNVVDQNGRQRKFYSELVKDKVVIVNFVFTTCTAVCPRSGANFRKLQSLLGERLGKEVFLISVSTDPETDTPKKLKSWGAQFSAKKGWTLVTGKKEQITPLLLALTGDGPNKGYHEPAIFIINDTIGAKRWVYGLEEPARVLKLADELRTTALR